MLRRVAAYMLLPIELSDFRVLKHQGDIVGRAFARIMVAAGLLQDGYGEDWAKTRRRAPGIWRVLVDSSRRYLATIAPGSETATLRAGAQEARELLSQGIVLATAWCAFGTIVSGAMLGLGKLLIATASAADSAGLPANSNGDVADDMLASLFVAMGSSGTALATAFGNMLAIMSVSAFAIAGAGILVTSGVMLVEWVYHPDSFSQKYNPWVYVLRAGLALSLLFPASNGFDFGQYLALQAIKWGSDKASSAWAQAGSGFGDFTQLVAQPMAPKLGETIANLWAVDVCRSAVQYGPLFQQDNASIINGGSNGSAPRWDLVIDNSVVTYEAIAAGMSMTAPNGVAYCGAVTPATVVGSGAGAVGQTVSQAQLAAFNQVEPQVKALADRFVQNNVASICPAQGSGGCSPVNESQQLADLVASYQNNVSQQLTSIWQSSSSMVDMTSNFSTGGWAAAGSWARRISDANGLMIKIGSAVPAVQLPAGENLYGEAADAVAAARETMSAAGQIVAQKDPTNSGALGGGTSNTVLDAVFQPLMNNVFQVVNVDNLQPLASVASIGNTMILTTEGVVGVAALVARPQDGGVSGAAKGFGAKLASWLPGPVGMVASLYGKLSGVREVVAAMMPLIWSIGIALILAGIGLAYIVPMLPAIRFLFAVIGWLVAVVEVVILVPVMLVLMVSPEGAGILAPMAKSCFFTIVAVVLRPLVTVLAFIASLMMVSVAIAFLNATYLAEFRDATGGVSWGVVGFLTFMVLYFVLVYTAMNTIFKLPETVTHGLYRWLGSNAGGERDDAAGIAAAASVFAGRITAGIQDYTRRQRR